VRGASAVRGAAEVPKEKATKESEGPGRFAPALFFALIHPSAWKTHSPKIARNTTKIVHVEEVLRLAAC
jgi:hypothetical protein